MDEPTENYLKETSKLSKPKSSQIPYDITTFKFDSSEILAS